MRNPKFNRHGGIDVEVYDDVRGRWLPYSIPANPTDAAHRSMRDQALAMTPTEYLAPPVVIKSEDVTRARNEMVAEGFTFDRRVFQADPVSLLDIAGAALIAHLHISAGGNPSQTDWVEPGVDFVWLSKGNAEVTMTPAKMIDFAKAALLHKTRLVRAARAIKNQDPIPKDYRDRIAALIGG